MTLPPNLGVSINLDGGTATPDGIRKALRDAADRGVTRAMLSVPRKLHGGEKGITWQSPEMVGLGIIRCFTEWKLIDIERRQLTLYTGNYVGVVPNASLYPVSKADIYGWAERGFLEVVIDWLGGLEGITDNQLALGGLAQTWRDFSRRGMASGIINRGRKIGVRVAVEPESHLDREELCLYPRWVERGKPSRPDTLDVWFRTKDGATPTIVREAAPLVRVAWINAGERELWDGLTAGVA